MSNITWHQQSVSRRDRESLNGHKGCVVWFTGLSGSGKSTIANAVDQKLHSVGVHSYVLDGDNVRHGLNASPETLSRQFDATVAKRFGLGFAPEDRAENIRRIGAVAKLFCDAGLIALTAFVSPYRADRDAVRVSLNEGDFVEVFVNTPLELCEQRDPKGLYRRARAGEIHDLTGVDAPYEAPESAELVLDAESGDVQQLADQVVAYLKKAGRIR